MDTEITQCLRESFGAGALHIGRPCRRVGNRKIITPSHAPAWDGT